MARFFRGAVLLLPILSISVACHSPSVKPVSPAAAPAPPPPAPDPDNIRWVRESAEYVAATLQAYRAVTSRVESEGPKHPAGAWAVILDADETILNNSTYQRERARQGLGYSQESWTAWVRRREAAPIPGAARFLARTRDLGGKIAIVTNRLGSECDDTIAVFQAQALVYDAILCRPDGSPSDKQPRFDAVARGQTPAGAQPLAIVAFVGDNILDFPGMTQTSRALGDDAFREFGVRFFLVPNPLYGSWQQLPPKADPGTFLDAGGAGR
jgi:5'-nucleotidase (lipoprotein e(P4) family)